MNQDSALPTDAPRPLARVFSVAAGVYLAAALLIASGVWVPCIMAPGICDAGSLVPVALFANLPVLVASAMMLAGALGAAPWPRRLWRAMVVVFPLWGLLGFFPALWLSGSFITSDFPNALAVILEFLAITSAVLIMGVVFLWPVRGLSLSLAAGAFGAALGAAAVVGLAGSAATALSVSRLAAAHDLCDVRVRTMSATRYVPLSKWSAFWLPQYARSVPELEPGLRVFLAVASPCEGEAAGRNDQHWSFHKWDFVPNS